MLRIVIAQPDIKIFKTCIETVANVFSGPKTFKFMPDRMQFQGMDQGSVFVFFDILKEYFKTYELDNDVLELRVDVGDFKKILSRPMDESELLTMEFNSSNKLELSFKKDTNNNKRKYELALHNPDDDTEKRDIAEVIKSIPLTVGMNCKSGLLKKAFGDVAIAAEKDAKHLIVTGNHDIITFQVNNGSEGMNALVELPTGEQDEYEVLTDDPIFNIKASYDMEYIDKVIKLDDLTTKTLFQLDTDKPARFTFRIHEYIEFVFVEAPLVEEADDESDDSNTDEYGADEGPEE